jgi:hypothetical protein
VARLTPSDDEARVFAGLTSSAQSAGQRFLRDWSSLPTWRDRARFALVHVFPSREYMRRRYGVRHDALVPAYYPYRWWLGLRSLVVRQRRR